jgi:uncharacterized protein YjiS (DUF1127 family)
MCLNETFRQSFHPSALDWRRLTPAQRADQARRIVAQAHVARARALYAALNAALARPVRRAAAAVAAAWRVLEAWYERRQAIRELSALDDRSLRDIGLNRSQIEAAVSGSARPSR